MVFTREVVEEGAFADVGGFGDVFDSGFKEAFFCEESESGLEKAFAKFGAAALTAGRPGSKSGGERQVVGAGGTKHD